MGERSGPAFEISERPWDGAVVVALTGDLDYATVAPLQERLGAAIDRGEQAIVIDLSQATLVTSSVLNVLFAAIRRMRYTGGGLAIVCINPHIRKLLALTALDKAAPVLASLADAVASIARGSLGPGPNLAG